MKLFVVCSGWINWSNDQQQLTSLLKAETPERAILVHLKDGDIRWPNYYHIRTPTIVEISQQARKFAADYPE